MEKQPEVAVGAYILNRKGELLLVKSHKWGDKWVIPGGHVEYGEAIADAAEREVLEETGLKVRFERVLMVNESIFSPDFHDKRRHFIFLEALCRAVAEKPKLDGRELQAFKWARPKAALAMKLEKTTRKVIKEALVK